jgi:hypothetical protein
MFWCRITSAFYFLPIHFGNKVSRNKWPHITRCCIGVRPSQRKVIPIWHRQFFERPSISVGRNLFTKRYKTKSKKSLITFMIDGAVTTTFLCHSFPPRRPRKNAYELDFTHTGRTSFLTPGTQKLPHPHGTQGYPRQTGSYPRDQILLAHWYHAIVGLANKVVKMCPCHCETHI